MSDFFEIRERLRRQYVAPIEKARGEAIGDHGFLTEVSGRLILTAPATPLTVASELPVELADRWQKASTGNPHMTWLQGRFVEAEKANRNGAFWSTEDLQFGEMSVNHGPLNWLHQEQTIIGTIADNAIVQPKAPTQQAAYTAINGTFTTTTTANLLTQPMPRPFIAAVSAMWNWVHPDKVRAVTEAAEQGRLYYSMECIAREMSCGSDETHEGCGKSFDYVQAMTDPKSTCEHIASRSSARRMVDPTFLGGAVIVPPTQPGWGAANLELVRQAAGLAEQTHASAGDMGDSEWEALMAQVVRFATSAG